MTVCMTPLEEPHCSLTAVITELITKIITRANYINFHQNRISMPCECHKDSLASEHLL